MRKKVVPGVAGVAMKDCLVTLRSSKKVVVKGYEAEEHPAQRGLVLKLVFQKDLPPQEGHGKRWVPVRTAAKSGGDEDGAPLPDC